MHSTFMDGSGHPPHPPNFPSNWDWERFKVVDAGNGRIAGCKEEQGFVGFGGRICYGMFEVDFSCLELLAHCLILP